VTATETMDREARVRAQARRIRKNPRWRGDDVRRPPRRVSPERLSREFVAEVRGLYASGYTIERLARAVRASTYTVLAALHKAGVDTSRRRRVKRQCEVCGRVFHAKPSAVEYGFARACSLDCGNELRRRKALARGRRAGRVVTCPCGRRFWAWRSRLARGYGKYCSLACAGRYRRRGGGDGGGDDGKTRQ